MRRTFSSHADVSLLSNAESVLADVDGVTRNTARAVAELEERGSEWTFGAQPLPLGRELVECPILVC
jgi:hypothetical protein